MLYPEPAIELRDMWFKTWLKQQTTETYGRISDFHLFVGDGHQAHNLVYSNGMKQTVSISNIFVQDVQSK